MNPGIIEQGRPPQETYEGDFRGRGGVEQREQIPEGEQLDRFLRASSRIVQQNRKQLKRSVEAGGMAKAASVVFDKIDSSFQGLPDMVRFFGGIGVLSQIAEAAEKDGVKNLSEEERIRALGVVLAEQIKKGIESGKYDPNEMLQAAEQAQGILRASQESSQETKK